VIFYADRITESIRRTQEAVTYRRQRQLAYNLEHGITPRSVRRAAQSSLQVYDGSGARREEAVVAESADDVAAVVAELEEEMQLAAERLEFERAAVLRDQINALKSGKFHAAAGRPKDYPRARTTAAAVRGKSRKR
jgi:excinuclease ABC subunit B